MRKMRIAGAVAAALVAAVTLCPDSGARPFQTPPARTVPDAELQGQVKAALAATLGTRSGEITVLVRDGYVLLHGTAYSSAARRAAERSVTRVPGVNAVDNKLQVAGG
jgi:osmotically-inducible protein OsmY